METQGFFLVRKGQAADAFELRTFEIFAPSPNEVQIEVEAFGLNYADVMCRKGLYKEAPQMPCIIGYEVVGKVIQTGKDIPTEWLGKRVLAFTRFGAYAKHVNTPLHGVVEIKDIPAEQMMALATQGVTAYYMNNYIQQTRKDDKVLIHAAAGGVGSLLIQLAKLNGAIVFAKVGSEDKRKTVHSLGADYSINYNKEDYRTFIKDKIHSDRLDLIFNPIAGSTFKKDFELLGSDGKLILFGGSELSNGKWGIFSALNFLRKMGLLLPIGLMMRSKSILGVNMLKVADFKPQVISHCLAEMVNLYLAGQLKITEGGLYPSNELSKAHTLLEKGQSEGKITIYWTK